MVQVFRCGFETSSVNLILSLYIGLLFLSQIKALISAPAAETTPGETKKPTEEPAVTKTPAADSIAGAASAPKPKPKPKPEPNKTAKALGLLGKRTFDK